MRRTSVLQLLLLEIIVLSLSNISCCNHQKKLISQKNIDLAERTTVKRGLLVPPANNDSIHEKSENTPEQFSSEIKEETRRNIEQSSQEHINSLKTEQNDKQNSTSLDDNKPIDDVTPHIQVKYLSDNDAFAQKLTGVKENQIKKRRSVVKEVIKIGKKLKQMRQEKNKKIMCICEEAKCKNKQCLQNGARDENSDDKNYVDYNNDEYDEDTSAEEIDDHVIGAPNRQFEEKAKSLEASEPTKFNIPFINNVHFDKRTSLGNKDQPDTLLPFYRNSRMKLQPKNLLFPWYNDRAYSMEYSAQSYPVVKPVYATPKVMNNFSNQKSPITVRPNYENGPLNYLGMGRWKTSDSQPKVDKVTKEYIPIYASKEILDDVSNNGTRKTNSTERTKLHFSVFPKSPEKIRAITQKSNGPTQSNLNIYNSQQKPMSSTLFSSYSANNNQFKPEYFSKEIAANEDEKKTVDQINDIYAYSTDVPNDSKSSKDETLQYATSKTVADHGGTEFQSSKYVDVENSRLPINKEPTYLKKKYIYANEDLMNNLRNQYNAHQIKNIQTNRVPYTNHFLDAMARSQFYDSVVENIPRSSEENLQIQIDKDTNAELGSIPLTIITNPSSNTNIYSDPKNTHKIIIQPPDSYNIESIGSIGPDALYYHDNTPAANNQYMNIVPSALRNFNNGMAISNINKQKASALRTANIPFTRLLGYKINNNNNNRNFMLVKSPSDETNFYQNDDPNTLLKGLEPRIISNQNIDDAMRDSHEQTTVENNNDYTQTQNVIQAIDDKPVPHNYPRYKSDETESDNQFNQNNSHQDHSNYNDVLSKNSYAVLQNIVRKVLNNFVPGKAQDLLANYGSSDIPDIINESIENLMPEIMSTSVLKNLFSVPEVENMITDVSSNLLTHVIDIPLEDDIKERIKNTLRDIVNQIPETQPTSPPYEDHQWVTQRMSDLEKSKSMLLPRQLPKKVFDKIQNIINTSGLDKQAVGHPLVQNLIVKTVKHSLDQEAGVIDEAAIRKAMDLIVQQKKLSDTNDNKGASDNNYQWPAGQGKGPLTNDEDYKNDNSGFNRERMKQLLKNLKTPNAFDIVSTEDPKLDGNSPQDYSTEQKEPIKYYSPNDRMLEYIKNHMSTNSPIPTTTRNDHNFEHDTNTNNMYSTQIPKFQNNNNYPTEYNTNYYGTDFPAHDYKAHTERNDNLDMTENPETFLRLPNTEMPDKIYKTTASFLDKIKNEIKLLTNSTTNSPNLDTKIPRAEDSIEEKNGSPRQISDLSSSSNDPSYMGKLVPTEYSKAAEAKDLMDLQGSNLVYVGDGVRLPLTIRKLQDGSFALMLADDVCKQFTHKKCPCCLPDGVNGVIMRERRSKSRNFQMNFAEDETISQEDSSADRIRRDSTEMNEIMNKKIQNSKIIKDKMNNFLKKNKKSELPPKKNTNTKNDYYNQSDEYFGEIFIDDWNNENRNSVSSTGPPYKYQRKAEEDESIKIRTDALKNVLNWMKETAISSSTPPKPARKKRELKRKLGK